MTTPPSTVLPTFENFKLTAPIRKALLEMGFQNPSPIQSETLPILLDEPTDFLGLAATGTGKTAAFAIPALERIQPQKSGVQTLVLCPTRELAVQVAGQINLLGKYKGIRALPIYGGAGYDEQIRGLKQGVAVVVGTPGRVVDHMNRGTLKLGGLKTLILDEADEMISMGFKEDLEAVMSGTPEGQANIWLFSATMNSEVRRVADRFLKQPKKVQINRDEMLSSTVEQFYFITQESNKPEVLCKLIDAAPEFYGIIFCQTKALVADLNQYLNGRGYRSDCLHGDMDQKSRERTIKNFREKKFRILIATDVACRGLDVNDVSHVVNYSIPRELDNYVHRIGRTARIGKAGVAFSLVTQSHRGLIGRIEKMTRSKMLEGKIPTRKEIGTKKLAGVREEFTEVKNSNRAVELLDADWKPLLEKMTKEEIVGRFLALKFPEVFSEAEAKEKPMRAPEARYDRGPSRGNDRGFDRGQDRGGAGRRYGRDRGERSDRGERADRGERTAGERTDRIPVPRENQSGGDEKSVGADAPRARKPHWMRNKKKSS